MVFMMVAFSFIMKKKISASNNEGKDTTAINSIDTIAYLIELAYDFLISLINNMWENPGF